MADGEDAAAARRRAAITDYRKKLLNCRELESRVGTGESSPSPSTSCPHPPCSTLVSLGFGGGRFPCLTRGFCGCVRGI